MRVRSSAGISKWTTGFIFMRTPPAIVAAGMLPGEEGSSADYADACGWRTVLSAVHLRNLRIVLQQKESTKSTLDSVSQADVVAPPARRLDRQRLAGESRYSPAGRRHHRLPPSPSGAAWGRTANAARARCPERP